MPKIKTNFKNLNADQEQPWKIALVPLLWMLVFYLLFSCTLQDTEPEQQNSYWGCWTEATNREGVYDIILQPGSFAFAEKCEPLVSFDIGYFRNDTLILDNGNFEYWCFLKKDTLLYSEGANSVTEKLILKPP